MVSRKSVGYFEGTDSAVLTSLVCAGYDTHPVSNGYDTHGRHVRLINEENRYDLLIGYLHKVFAPEHHDPSTATFQDVFHLCRTYRVPLLLEVPSELHQHAGALLDDPDDTVTFVDPADTLAAALKILTDG